MESKEEYLFKEHDLGFFFSGKQNIIVQSCVDNIPDFETPNQAGFFLTKTGLLIHHVLVNLNNKDYFFLHAYPLSGPEKIIIEDLDDLKSIKIQSEGIFVLKLNNYYFKHDEEVFITRDKFQEVLGHIIERKLEGEQDHEGLDWTGTSKLSIKRFRRNLGMKLIIVLLLTSILRPFWAYIFAIIHLPGGFEFGSGFARLQYLPLLILYPVIAYLLINMREFKRGEKKKIRVEKGNLQIHSLFSVDKTINISKIWRVNTSFSHGIKSNITINYLNQELGQSNVETVKMFSKKFRIQDGAGFIRALLSW